MVATTSCFDFYWRFVKVLWFGETFEKSNNFAK